MKIELNDITLTQARALLSLFDKTAISDTLLAPVYADLKREIEKAEGRIQQVARRGVMRAVVSMDYEIYSYLPWILKLECGHTVKREHWKHQHGKPPRQAKCILCPA